MNFADAEYEYFELIQNSVKKEDICSTSDHEEYIDEDQNQNVPQLQFCDTYIEHSYSNKSNTGLIEKINIMDKDVSIKIEDVPSTSDFKQYISDATIVKNENLPQELLCNIKIENSNSCCVSIKNGINLTQKHIKSEDIIEIPARSLQQRKPTLNMRYKYQCPFCKKRYLSVNQRSKHNCRRYFEICYYCGQYFYDRINFLNHFFLYHFIKITINIDNDLYNRHTKMGGIYIKQLQYSICAGKFQRKLENVCSKMRPRFPVRRSVDRKMCVTLPQMGTKTFNSDEKPYKCEICPRDFQRIDDLQRHMSNHTGQSSFECIFCPSTFKHASDLKRHISLHTGEKPFKCEICSHTFIEVSALHSHMRIHVEVKPFKCEICSKTFAHLSHLKAHMVMHTGEKIHTIEKRFKCEICQRSFNNRASVKQHMIVHTGEKPFKCEICQNHFASKSYLTKHQRIHTGEKPFKCEICFRTFSQTSILKSHMLIHTGRKRFTCEICSCTFSQTSNLKRHIRSHTGVKPFICEICQQTFSSKSGLTIHTRIHTGEKPFKCEICSNTFSYKCTLQKHIRMHTGEKPFNCDICQRSFSVKSNLKRHMIIHN